jgi:hypothetical protein
MVCYGAVTVDNNQIHKFFNKRLGLCTIQMHILLVSYCSYRGVEHNYVIEALTYI